MINSFGFAKSAQLFKLSQNSTTVYLLMLGFIVIRIRRYLQKYDCPSEHKDDLSQQIYTDS
ncbi:hypothetical protein CC78DRAFT_533032 [Lojkania enalia]|uniref:Uncharacterized protein n=1 Tax=Lojkania enalia TaxID=147567 RepID=A0A9P4K8R2_9PLEO|nr:hypothetical protein CC78DRAFT_533032 [Didymosphaeria enalia]